MLPVLSQLATSLPADSKVVRVPRAIPPLHEGLGACPHSLTGLECGVLLQQCSPIICWKGVHKGEVATPASQHTAFHTVGEQLQHQVKMRNASIQ
jgi:hypothetical protein